MKRNAAPTFVLLGLAALLVGCGNGEEAEREPEAVVATQDKGSGLTETVWLAPTDRTEPALWLVQRASDGTKPDAGAIANLRRALGEAKPHFVEDQRMIANRTAQLEAMLAEIGEREDPAALIAGLTGVAAAGGRRQLYGEMCQHYVTVRRAGLGRDATLARLVERYGAQDRSR
ncbi:hypothetical protein [Methylobacterium oxalidis]|uniref:MxaH protein n=1 Tax=Methylobacterium oxalidis TaxID=944322 RepID=A0A512JB13_9HYPH|nr:hypothetical protein [Methylobacterium oxalidis]GEP07075.1 hypothetical protein MOX02_51130 [Methylobacterium oxalidis]GJE33891.1 hypothetical protein LDDCCGHA_4095 [Methylobacterium oxalidis]GLS66419.1 hypothetical protein GCM10007888_48020 [Methylobacterium oxalidis]